MAVKSKPSALLGVFCLLLALTCEAASAENFSDVCKTGTPEQIKAMIDAGADVNAKDEHGMTPLMWAAQNQNSDVIAALLKAGADLNAKDGKGNTALDRARAYKNEKAATALIKAGAQGK